MQSLWLARIQVFLIYQLTFLNELYCTKNELKISVNEDIELKIYIRVTFNSCIISFNSTAVQPFTISKILIYFSIYCTFFCIIYYAFQRVYYFS